jgi:hypothetical protein
MNYIQTPDYFGKTDQQSNGASWVNIVDLIFDIVAHHERLAIKRKARGDYRCSRAPRNQTHAGRK